MPHDDISSTNALVYFIEKTSNDWNFENPYYQALKHLFHDEKEITLLHLRPQQQFHFIAKLIQDELNNNISEINNNVNSIQNIFDSYFTKMNQIEGDYILSYLYIILILKK